MVSNARSIQRMDETITSHRHVIGICASAPKYLCTRIRAMHVSIHIRDCITFVYLCALRVYV